MLQIRRDKLSALQQAGRVPFQETAYPVDAYAKDINENFDEYEGKTVSIAGRILSKRGMGKAGFIDVQDHSGRIQSYVRKDHLGDEEYEWFKKYDIGDIIGIHGEVFRTQKGQISVKADEIRLLSKSLLPLPEKWHGLKDTDTALPAAVCRSDCQSRGARIRLSSARRFMQEIRAFLDGRGFMEVDTPILTPFEIGAAARPFVTHHNTLDMDMYAAH